MGFLYNFVENNTQQILFMIIYKNTDKWYNEWKWGKTRDNKW